MLRLIVFAEAEADTRTGCDLGDRVLLEDGPEWLVDLPLEHIREWTDVDGERGFTKWTDLKQKPSAHRRSRYLGHRPDGARGADYAMAVKALLLVQNNLGTQESPVAVVMLRDCDASRDKRKGLYQVAEDERFKNINIVLGIADKMREAWVLNGFVAKDDTERKILDSLKSELALDPVKEAHRLRAPNKSDERNPKCVLARLTGEDLDREACCWRETPLDELRQRGKDTGLEAYLDNLRHRLIPLLDLGA